LRQRKDDCPLTRDTVGVPGKPRIPHNPKFPERICWGCDKYCPADDLACGNGTIRTLHPVELFGPDWQEWADHKGTAAENDESPAALQDS
jgi:hypothetical protein